MNSFTYNGINSADMGLRIESKNVFSAPKYDVTFVKIPGRNGDLIQQNGRFPNAQVTYTVFLPAKSQQELADRITAVKNWLYTGLNSYHELRDTYDNMFFRKAVFASKLSIKDELGKIGTFTISFSCQPFRYSDDGQVQRSFEESITLTNPYPIEAKPLILLIGLGNSSLRITNGGVTKTWSFLNVDAQLTVDSESMLVYRNNVSAANKMSGDGFPTLKPGENLIELSGNAMGAQITPRWCTL